MATQDDYIRTALRVPPDLHAQIHEAAKRHNRTFNAEIVARLEGSFAAAAFPARDQDELDAMVNISMAQADFHVAQSRASEAANEFFRAQMRYDSLCLQDQAYTPGSTLAHLAEAFSAERDKAKLDMDRAELKLKEASAEFRLAEKRLADAHAARVRSRAEP